MRYETTEKAHADSIIRAAERPAPDSYFFHAAEPAD
jgi:hypothetical protein